MRNPVAMIAVRIVSGAMAEYRTETAIGLEDRKDICTDDDISDLPGKKAYSTYTCEDPKTDKKEKVQCMNPPKQKLPPKITMAELDDAFSPRSENRF